jgi:hypothetical protein
LRIIHEDPGRRLELAETEGRAAPLAIGLALTVLVATPWRWLWAAAVHGAGRDSLDLVPSAIWAAGGLFLVLSSFGGQRLEVFSVDRVQGRLEWRRSHVLGLLRWRGGFPLESLHGFTLALASRPGASSATLRLALQRGPGQRGRRLELSVASLAGTQAIADFALRLGAAAGLPFYRVTLNEGGRFEIELRAQAGPGLDRVSPLDRSASEPGVSSSSVAKAVAAVERLPPFDPTAFRGDARVACWEPGREVRFDKGWGAPALLSPLLLCAPLGPWAFFRLASMQTMPLLPKIAALLLLTFVGFGLALVGWACLQSALPRRVRLDWTTRTLLVETVRESRAIPLADVSDLELRHKSFSTGRAQGGMIRTSYWSQVRVGLRSPSTPADELLVETRSFEEDASAPRQMALPLARDLASALRVEVRETGPA